MGFKKHSWVRYGRSGDKVSIEIQDSSGAKIDYFMCNTNEDYLTILNIIKQKYGFSFKPEVSKEESINEIKKDEVNWLKKDSEW